MTVAEQGGVVSVFEIYLSDLGYADDVRLVDEDEKKATKELELLIFQFQTGNHEDKCRQVKVFETTEAEIKYQRLK